MLNIPQEINNPIKTITLGDSIIIVADFSESLIDINSGKEFMLPLDTLRLEFFLSRLDTLGGISTIDNYSFRIENAEFKASYFDYIPDLGFKGSYYNLYVPQKDNRYVYKIIIRPKFRGVFLLAVGNYYLFGFEGNEYDFVRNCDDVAFVQSSINNQMDNGWSLYDFWIPKLRGPLNKSEFDQAGGFVFEVK